MLYPKIKLKSEGGIHPKKCIPFQTIGTVVTVSKTVTTTECKDRLNCKILEKVMVTFEFELESGKKTTAYQIFHPGEVYADEIGQKMLGTALLTQWGSYGFRGTHILKDEQ